jgi:hypothetical protein
MTIETVVMRDRVAHPITSKLNPIWWLHGPDGWEVPTVNNGLPYLPDVKNIWLRRFYWFFCRNPLMNFVGFVLGVEDNNYRAIGPAPVLRTTSRDEEPPTHRLKWAVLIPQFSVGALAMTIVFGLATLLHWFFWVPLVFAALKVTGPLPYVSYYNGKVEFYSGWRPHSGGFGFKLVFPRHG